MNINKTIIKLGKNRIFKQYRLYIIIIVLILVGFVADSAKPTSDVHVTSVCNLSNISYGTDSIKVVVSKPAMYTVWLHVESPIQINYSVLPSNYNPLFVTIDNQTCYQAGGAGNMPLNSWTWINYINSNPSKLFSIELTQGVHTIAIAASYLSIDQIEVLKTGCSPSSNISCSAEYETQTFNH